MHSILRYSLVNVLIMTVNVKGAESEGKVTSSRIGKSSYRCCFSWTLKDEQNWEWQVCVQKYFGQKGRLKYNQLSTESAMQVQGKANIP